jgi:ubiquinone/menaquinone biosynthesis C-methylase UbiE
MKKEIPLSSAKEHLRQISKHLKKPHLLIGGLAIQQYVQGRTSKDIDLVCDSETVMDITYKVFPSRDYNQVAINDDEYRPSSVFQHRTNQDTFIFFGPKVLERDAYKGLNEEKLLIDSIPFKYKNDLFENIRVPSIENLAFLKLISFCDRVEHKVEKGQQDLRDFTDLSNQKQFRLNVLIDNIRSYRCGEYIHEKITSNNHYDFRLWDSAVFVDLMKMLSPILLKNPTYRESNTADDDPDSLYGLDRSVDFYNRISSIYDARNSEQLLETHMRIIHLINHETKNNAEFRILDIGGGTGKIIATQFFDKKNFHWCCVDPSKNMNSAFRMNMSVATIDFELFESSIYELPMELKERRFDIIVISCVLTSLSRDPDFSQIGSMLSENGILIIADIDPTYTQIRPYYDFKIDANRIALTPRMVNPLDLISKMKKENLILTTCYTIENRKKEKYSYVLKFRKKKMI